MSDKGKRLTLDYWQKYYSDKVRRHPDAFLTQVGKTVNGTEISIDQIKIIIENIRTTMNINNQDILADLGCGNGILTAHLSKHAKKVRGYDFTQRLISCAKEFHRENNIIYKKVDIRKLMPSDIKGINKFVMIEVLQHFDKLDLECLLELIYKGPSSTHFFIGGIPNRMRIKSFYNTTEKYKFFLQSESDNRPHMGSWWSFYDINSLSQKIGWEVQLLPQPKDLYTAHYRFDILLKKTS